MREAKIIQRGWGGGQGGAPIWEIKEESKITKQNTKKIINILRTLRGDTVFKEQVQLEKQKTQKTIQQKSQELSKK